MKDAAIRAARTFIQSLIGAFLATSFLQSVADTSVVDGDAAARAGLSALAAAIIATLTFVQNYLENYTGHTGLK